MSVFYRKYQNKNRQSVAYGKWFARAVTIGKTINIDELAKHMSEHNTPYSKGAIKGVLTDMIGCVRELMLEGKAVKLEGLAIFSAGIKTKKNGAPTSAEFSTTKHIDSVPSCPRTTPTITRRTRMSLRIPAVAVVRRTVAVSHRAAHRTEATLVRAATAAQVATPAATAVRRAAVRVAPRVTIDW